MRQAWDTLSHRPDSGAKHVPKLSRFGREVIWDSWHGIERNWPSLMHVVN